jgi:hypothetical protein
MRPFLGTVCDPDRLAVWLVGILAGATTMFVHDWRTDRRSAIEDLTMIASIGSSVLTADRFLDKVYGSLLGMIVVVGYLSIRSIGKRA